MTRYMAVVGPNSMWPPVVERYSTAEADGVRFRRTGRLEKEITDGLENTFLLVESPGDLVNWMEPRDLTLDELAALVAQTGVRDQPPHRIDGFFRFRYRTGWNAVFADGESIILVNDTIPRPLLSAVVTVNGREPLPELAALRPSWHFSTPKASDALYWAFLAFFWTFALYAVGITLCG